MPTAIGIGIGAPFGSGLWSPAQLAGLQAWWCASAGLFQDDACTTPAAADSVVGGWQVCSGSARTLTQGTTGLKPIYKAGATPNGLPAVLYDGTDDLLTVASKMGLASVPVLTWAVVCRPATVATGYRRIMGAYTTVSTRYRALRSDSSPVNFEYAWKYDDATNSSYHVGVTSVAWHVIVVRDNAGTLDYWLDGVKGTQQSYASGATTPTTFALGSGASGSAPFSGHIAGAVALNTAASDAECRALSAYMGARYGIAA